MPTRTHQHIVKLLSSASTRTRGRPAAAWASAGTRLKLPGNKYREPTSFAAAPNARYEGEEHWTGADLVVEGEPGPQDHDRDHVRKREEYARAGVGEYWIIDPELKTVLALVLRDGRYVEHATWDAADVARLATVADVAVDVARSSPTPAERGFRATCRRLAAYAPVKVLRGGRRGRRRGSWCSRRRAELSAPSARGGGARRRAPARSSAAPAGSAWSAARK